jgi:hypothetical protein
MIKFVAAKLPISEERKLVKVVLSDLNTSNYGAVGKKRFFRICATNP